MKGGALEVGKRKYGFFCLDIGSDYFSELYINATPFKLMIEVKNLEKTFGDQKVLKGISTLFEAGKTNLIIGQSGSGKTVFLKSLLGIHTPEVGTISFDGRIYSELDKDEKTRITHRNWYGISRKCFV